MSVVSRVKVPFHEHVPAVELECKRQIVSVHAKRIPTRPQGILDQPMLAIFLTEIESVAFKLEAADTLYHNPLPLILFRSCNQVDERHVFDGKPSSRAAFMTCETRLVNCESHRNEQGCQ